MERTKRIQIYVTADELQAIRLVSAQTSESMSEYTRRVVLKEVAQTAQATELNELRSELFKRIIDYAHEKEPPHGY